MTYAEQLQQPEWNARRWEIIERAGLKCEECGTDKGPLHVHHKYYEKGKMAWEYPDEALICLCDHHHKLKHIPDCCHTPLYQAVYDVDCRSEILLPIMAKFCPLCGKKIEVL